MIDNSVLASGGVERIGLDNAFIKVAKRREKANNARYARP